MNRCLTIAACVLAAQLLCPGVARAAEFAAIVPMQGGSAYYVPAQFGDSASADLLVDTGSGYLTINERTLQRLKQDGTAEYLKKISGVLADGSSTTVPVYRLEKVSIGCCCVVQDVEAAVFPGETRQILGMSALKKVAPFAVSVDPPQLSLSHCPVVPAQAANP